MALILLCDMEGNGDASKLGQSGSLGPWLTISLFRIDKLISRSLMAAGSEECCFGHFSGKDNRSWTGGSHVGFNIFNSVQSTWQADNDY